MDKVFIQNLVAVPECWPIQQTATGGSPHFGFTGAYTEK